MPGLADGTILEVLAGTPTYQAALTAYSDSEAGVELNAVIRLARVSRALRAHAGDSLRALLGRASRPARYLVVTAPDDRVPFKLLQVLLPWVAEQLPPRGELPPIAQRNIAVCCAGSVHDARAATLVDRTVGRGVMARVRGKARARQDFRLAVWMSNIQARPGRSEFRVLPSYAWLVQGLCDTVSRVRVHGFDSRALAECCSACFALSAFAQRHETRTVPEGALDVWELLLGAYHSGTSVESPHSGQFSMALHSAQECCSHLDMFSLQLPRFLRPVTHALETTSSEKSAALLASAREVLESCFASHAAVTCTRAWPRNCTAYYALLCTCLFHNRATCGYLDFQALMAAVEPLRMPPPAVSRAVAGLATHVIWRRCAAAGDLDLVGMHAVVASLPRALHAADERAVFVAALRANSRRWATVPTPSCCEAWYLCAILHETLARFPYAVLRRRAVLRTAFEANVRQVLALCTTARQNPDALSRQRIVFYTVTVLRDLARASTASAYAKRRPPFFLPLKRVHKILAGLPGYALGSNYCVLLPLFQIVFSILDQLPRESRGELLRAVSPDLVRLWFEHHEAVELSPLLLLCFLAEYARVWPHLPLLMECCRSFVSVARPARLGPIAEVLLACHAHHTPDAVLQILSMALAPEDDGAAPRPWTPRCAGLVARVACTGLPETRGRPEMAALTRACARARNPEAEHTEDPAAQRALHALRAASHALRGECTGDACSNSSVLGVD